MLKFAYLRLSRQTAKYFKGYLRFWFHFRNFGILLNWLCVEAGAREAVVLLGGKLDLTSDGTEVQYVVIRGVRGGLRKKVTLKAI